MARVPERIQQVRTNQGSQVVEVTVQHNLAQVGNCTGNCTALHHIRIPWSLWLWRLLHRMQGVAREPRTIMIAQRMPPTTTHTPARASPHLCVPLAVASTADHQTHPFLSPHPHLTRRRGRDDKTGYEPRGLFNVVEFVMNDKEGVGYISLEEAMQVSAG